MLGGVFTNILIHLCRKYLSSAEFLVLLKKKFDTIVVKIKAGRETGALFYILKITSNQWIESILYLIIPIYQWINIKSSSTISSNRIS